MKNRSISFWNFLFTLPPVLLYTIFFIFPVLYGFFYSLTDWNGISREYDIIGFKNYFNILTDKRFRNSILFTFEYSIILVVSVIILALILALLLDSTKKGKGVLKSIYFFPAVLSLITIGLIFNEIYYRILPQIGEFLGIDFLSKNLLANPKAAIYAVVLVNIWNGTSVPTVLFLAALQSVPVELYQAADIDGANSLEKFINITLPYLIPTINVIFVITLKGGLMVYDFIVALTGGGPGRATESVGLLIFRNGFEENRFSYSVAESVILFIILALVSYLQIRLSKDKEVSN